MHSNCCLGLISMIVLFKISLGLPIYTSLERKLFPHLIYLPFFQTLFNFNLSEFLFSSDFFSFSLYYLLNFIASLDYIFSIICLFLSPKQSDDDSFLIIRPVRVVSFQLIKIKSKENPILIQTEITIYFMFSKRSKSGHL